MKHPHYFKKADLSDCPTIQTLAGQIWEPTYGNILSPEQLEFMFDWMYSVESLENQLKSGHTFFILYEDEKPIGYVSVEKEKEKRYHLQKIYMLPEKQGQGLGKILLEKAESFVRELNPNETVDLVLNVNRHNRKAIDFYKRKGFVKESEGDFDIGNGYYMCDYILVKQLAVCNL